MSKYQAEVERAGKLADGGEPDAAMEICNRVLLDEPDNPQALYVVGVILAQAARHTQLIQVAKRLTEIKPKAPLGWSLLATAYAELHRYDESIKFAERAAACRRDAKTVSDLAYVNVNAGNYEAGHKFALDALKLAQGDETIRGKEAARDALIHETYCQLAFGNWRAGFEGYRRTMRTKWRKEWQYNDSKEWWGEQDAVVMVTGEQGIGDEVMAASAVPDAIRSCKTFILDCDARLADLFRRSFPDAIVTPTRREREITLPVMPTHHKSMFGLSELFRHEDSDFPRRPYLVPRADYVAMFKALLAGDGPIIGLAWSGGLLRTGQEPRTAGLNAFLPLLRRGGARFVSLQYKDDAEEVAALEREHGIKVLRYPWATQAQDVDLLAAFIAAMDEVVGVHTTALHLSSAMGIPTTVLTHRGSGWRYARPELLWYPPTTVQHKKKPGESWRECVSRLVEVRKSA